MAGTGLEQLISQIPAQQTPNMNGGMLNQTPYTAYQPNYSMLYSPVASMLNQQPSYSSPYYSAMPGQQNPQQNPGQLQPVFPEPEPVIPPTNPLKFWPRN